VSKLEYKKIQVRGENSELHLDGLRLSQWTGPEQISKYIYSKSGLLDRWAFFNSALKKALSQPEAKSQTQKFSVHYAMKANSNLEVLKLWKSQGLGVDIVSGGELKQALKAGFTGFEIIFSGVGKSKEEIRMALSANIRQFNVESAPELERLAELAKERGPERGAKASVVLRVNPDVDAKTHPYISTGFRENKFGIGLPELSHCLEVLKTSSSLKLVGLSCHIGSQLRDLSALKEAWQKMRKLYEELQAQGFQLSILDLGGGLGIDYAQEASSDLASIEQYSQLLKSEFGDLKTHFQFEPGRILVARSGVLLTEVQYIKETREKNFVICSSGMNHLMRPALYQAEHRIFQMQLTSGGERASSTLAADVVGPICESSDFLGKNRSFQNLKAGDWIAVADVGAYGASMMSSYNLFPLAEEILA
jgi:diaminopimelate decarboxylase